jgi:uncharacterized repeat protein (TIGR01451 family)
MPWKNWIRTLASGLTSSSGKPPRKSTKRRRGTWKPALELLEDRIALSVLPPSNLTLAFHADSGIVGDDITNVTRPEIDGNAAAGATVKIYAGTFGNFDATRTQVGSGIARPDGTFQVTSSTALSDGMYSIEATATNGSGTSGFSNELTDGSGNPGLIIDTSAPRVSNPTPAQTMTVADQLRIDITSVFNDQVIGAIGGIANNLLDITPAVVDNSGVLQDYFIDQESTGVFLVIDSTEITGTAQVTLTASDQAGNSDSSQQDVFDVTVHPPSLGLLVNVGADNSGNPSSVEVGGTVNLNNILQGAGLNESFTYAWSVDGGAAVVGPSDDPTSFSFIAGSSSTYHVSLTVTDALNSAITKTAEQDIVVPMVSNLVVSAGSGGQSISLSGTVGDQEGVQNSGYQVDTVIDWGDNSTPTTLHAGDLAFTSNGVGSFSGVAHTYRDAGTYTVSVTATDYDSTHANIIATSTTITGTTTVTPAADLSVSTTDNESTVVPGTNDTYTITVSNNGPGTVTAATISDVLPAGTTFVSATLGGAYDVGSNTVHWTLGTLAAGNSTSVTVTLAINPGASGTLTNTAMVSPPSGVVDPVPGNNSSPDTDTLTAQLDVSVVVNDGVITVVPGETTSYTIVVTNSAASPSTAFNVQVNDPLPAGVASASWNGTDGNSGTGNLADTISSLAPGASVTYTLVATISNPVPTNLSAITNSVTITAANDTSAADNTATDIDGLPVPAGNQSFYPNSATSLTSAVFNESSVLASFGADVSDEALKLFYTDEHAMALGVSAVTVITSSSSKTTNYYTVSPLTTDPGSIASPSVGAPYYPPSSPLTSSQSALALAQGNQTQPGATDAAGRPMFPSLYLTDITNMTADQLASPAGHAGDWQYGGTPIAPTNVFGAWKSFTETIDRTKNTVTLTGAADPANNGWNLGPGADTPPAGLTSQNYGAEARWSLDSLAAQGLVVPGHSYRFYVTVHDGDQNQTGGDIGQACFDFYYPGPIQNPSSLSGTVYNDANNDGIKQSTEAGIAGVTVKLLDKNGIVFSSTTTGTNGSYTFKNLPAGTSYRIVEVQPSNYVDGKDTQGTFTGAGSNVSAASDIFTVAIRAAGNAVGSGFNFGEILGNNSATSTVNKAFNGTAIAAGNTLWFSSVVKMGGLTTSNQGDVILRLANAFVTVTPKSGSAYTISVPNAEIVFENTVTDATAAATFNAATNTWVTTVGKTTKTNYLLDALPWAVPASGLAGANFSWTGTFLVDTAGVNVTAWAGAAAVYTTGFPATTPFNNVGVKPVDGSASQYANNDPAGTPENEKSYLTAGALGNGGPAYIGSYTGNQNATPVVVPGINTIDPTETFQTTPVTPQLLAAGAIGLGGPAPQALTDAQLAPIVHEAIQRWAAAGANLAKLAGMRFGVADLPAGMLGLTTNGFIQIDVNAAGMGWFIDPIAHGNATTVVTPDNPAWGHVDLLSVVEHEIGNVLGIPELHTGTQQVMEFEISTGVLRTELPAHLAAVHSHSTVSAALPVRVTSTRSFRWLQVA